MTWEQPTYEDYIRATPFARLRYKYGLIIIVLSWLSIIGLIVYTMNYVEELSTDPLKFAAKQHDLQCSCLSQEEQLYYKFNETEVWIEPITYLNPTLQIEP